MWMTEFAWVVIGWLVYVGLLLCALVFLFSTMLSLIDPAKSRFMKAVIPRTVVTLSVLLFASILMRFRSVELSSMPDLSGIMPGMIGGFGIVLVRFVVVPRILDYVDARQRLVSPRQERVASLPLIEVYRPGDTWGPATHKRRRLPSKFT
jgi:hypothetical protein